jgi:hypothetical protein
MIDPLVLKQLEEIVNSVDLTVLPYQKGNSIRIKQYVIRKSKHGYLLYDCKENKQITSLYSKTAAVAWANCLIKDKNYFKNIQELDNTISKHHIDSLFYRNTIEKTKDEIKQLTAEMRLEIALDRTQEAKANLMHYILT